MNFDFITDNMAVGTTPETPADVIILKKAGITHVLNVRDDVDDAELFADSHVGFDYRWNPTKDWTPLAALGKEPKSVEWFKTSLDFWPPCIEMSLASTWKLFVHCSAGVNRSATTAWMFLRAMQLKGNDCDFIIDSHRLIATFGTFFDHPWRVDAERALVSLGYINAN